MIMTTAALEQMFEACTITKEADADRIAKALQHRRARYEVFEPFPWWVVACVHYRESSLSMTRHLHNGDPLTARTKRIPANRPALGMPPFTWEESARDALSDRKVPETGSLGAWIDWLERYNGLGYRRRGLPSPYVWAGTSAYSGGLYVADGRFDPAAVDARLGCAAIIKALVAAKSVCFN